MTSKILQTFILLALIILCINAKVEANEDYKYALALMKERKEYKSAAEKFQLFISQNPKSGDTPKALFYMASCLARLGKDNSAGNSYEQIVKLYPATDTKLLIESYAYGADAYFRAELYEKASMLYSQLIIKYPDAKQVEASLYWSAECYNRLAVSGERSQNNPDYKKAINAYSELEKRYPDSRFLPDALASGGLLAYNFKDYRMSSKLLLLHGELETQIDGTKKEMILYHTGESLYWLKDYKAASMIFKNLLNEFPNGEYPGESYAGLGWCSYSLGNTLVAAQSFKKSAEHYTDEAQSTSAHFDAAAAFEEAGVKDTAIEEYYQVIKVTSHPKRQRSLVRLGILQKDMANISTADYLSEAFHYTGDNADNDLSIEAGILLAEMRLDNKEYSDAIKIFSRIIENFPSNAYAPFALYQLALAHAELKDYKNASTAIKLLLKNYPSSSLRLQAAYAIADYQSILGDTQKSHIAYKWLAERSEKWAETYLRNNKVEDPEKFTQDANDIAAASLLRLGESLYKQKDNLEAQAEAKNYFSNYITRYPDNPRLAAALLRLGELTESDNLQIAHTYFKNALTSANAVAEQVTNDNEFANIKMHAKYRLCLNNILLSQKAGKSSTPESKKYLKIALKNINEFLAMYSETDEAKELTTHLHYYKSEAEYSLGDVDAALAGYDSSYKENKGSSVADAALFSSAWIEQEQGNSTASIQKLETLLANYKESPYRSNALYILAIHKRKNNDLISASEYLDELLKNHPESEFIDKSKIELAKIENLQGEHKKAAGKLKEFLENNHDSPEYPNALYTLSWVYWAEVSKLNASGKDDAETLALYSEIENVLKELITQYPEYTNSFVAKFRLGEIAYDRKNYAKAASWYKETLKEEKSKIADKAHYRLAWCYLKLADSEKKYLHEALSEFLTICNSYPKSSLLPESALRAAKLFRQNEEYSKALPLYESAEKSGDNNDITMSAKYGKGITLLQLEEYSKALRVFKDYLTTNPNSPLIHEANWGAGQAALMLGASTDASDYFNSAKANNYSGEAAAKARFGLGVIAMEKKKFKLAREEFRKVDVFHSEWQEVAASSLLKAAEASKELGEEEPALADLKRILEIYSATSSALTAEEMLLTEGN